MFFDHDDSNNTDNADPQIVNSVISVLDKYAVNQLDRLSILAAVAQQIMEMQDMGTFESINYDGRCIRFVCPNLDQPRPTLH